MNPHPVPIQYDVEVLPRPLQVPKLWTGTIEPCCGHGSRRSFRMPLGLPQAYSVIVRTPLDFGISLTMWDGVWRETLTTIPQRFETCEGP